MKIRSKLLLSSFAFGAAAFASPAFAQSDIEIVTVTAAKRVQNVQDVPISMSVVGQKDLEKYNLSDLRDIAALIPGMTVSRTQTYNTMYLRGFGSNAAGNPAIDQTVALYQDGVFAGRARQYMAPFFDVSRIEVLRGPQGTLLGKNTAAGAISLVTNNPTEEFEAGATATYLIDRQGVDAFGYVSGPVTDDLGARLAVKYFDKNGWVKNLATNKDVPENRAIQGRLTLQWQPSEGVDIVTKFQYDNTQTDGRAATGYVGGLRSGVDRIQNSPGVLGLNDLDRNNSYHFVNTGTFSLGEFTLVSVSGFDAYKGRAVATARHTVPEVLTTDFVERFNQGSQEFRLLSPTGQTFEWIVGIYADYAEYHMDNIVRYSALPAGPFFVTGQMTSNFIQSAYTYSAYATGTWNITDDIRLIGGARGTQVNKKASYVLRTDSGFAIGVPKSLSDKLSEAYFDPSVTLQYDVTEKIMVYANWSRGSKGGVFQGANRAVTATSFQIKPEISTNYEIGAKTELWDWLTFNAAAFILDFKNLQGAQYVIPAGAPPGSASVLLTTNIGSATSRGFEVTLIGDLSDWIEGLSFKFGGAYLNTYYTDYNNAQCTFAAQQPANGTCSVTTGQYTTGPLAGQSFNGKGLRLQSVPIWSGTMEATYTRPIFDGLKVEFNVGADMTSNIWGDAAASYNPAIALQPGNTKLNFRVALGDIDDKWNVAVIGRNVNDVLTTSGMYTFAPHNVYTIDEGRSISIQGSVKL